MTAIRYYRGLESRQAAYRLGTKRPLSIATLIYGAFVAAAVVATVLALVSNYA